MKRIEILKTIDRISFMSAIIGVAFAILFEFSGIAILLNVAFFLYALTFASLALFLGLKIYFVFKKEEQKDEVFNLNKKSKGLLIFYFVFSVVAFAFVLAIFCMI